MSALERKGEEKDAKGNYRVISSSSLSLSPLSFSLLAISREITSVALSSSSLALSHSRASSSSSPCSNSFAKLFRRAIEYILQRRINNTTIQLPCGNFQWTVLTRLFFFGR